MMPHAARAHVASLGRCWHVNPHTGLACRQAPGLLYHSHLSWTIPPGHTVWHEQTPIGPVAIGATGEAGGHHEPGVYLPAPVVRARSNPRRKDGEAKP